MQDVAFFNNVLFVHEATSHKNGFVNRYNVHYNASEDFFKDVNN